MSITGMGLVWALIEQGDFTASRDYNVRPEMLRGVAREAYEFVSHHYRTHGVMPKRDTVLVDVVPAEEEDDYDFVPEEPATYYAEAVVKRAALHAQRKELSKVDEALAKRDPDLLHEIAKNIIRVGTQDFGMGAGTVVNIKDNRAERWERYQEAVMSDGGIQGIRSPWERLDVETCGFMPEDLITIVARLGMGKTWCALACAANAENLGYNVGFISMEMSSKAIETRRDSLRYRLPYRDFKRGELDHEVEQRYRNALEAEPKDDEPDWFIAAGGRVQDISDAELFVEETGIDFLIIDGIYLMSEGDQRMARHERIEAAVRGAKRLAQRKKIPIVITAQFNREIRSSSLRGDAGSIGGSDAIGQDSDVVLGLFQTDDMRQANQMMVRSLKIREGQPVEIAINWDFVRMNFSEMEDAGLGDGVENMDDDAVQETMY